MKAEFWYEPHPYSDDDELIDLTGAVLIGCPSPDGDRSRILVEKNGKRYSLINAESSERNMVERETVE